MLLAGVVFARRQKTTKSYFLASHSVPWWAIAASIVATETSTITFISVPGIAWAKGGDFRFLQIVFGYVVARLIIAAVFMPWYFRGELVTVYELLQTRFAPSVKALAATLFVVMRTIADGVRLLLTAYVVAALTDHLGVTGAIIGLGVIMTIFTLTGGIEAIVWIEVVQLAIYIGGAIAAAVVLLGDVGFDHAMALGVANEKFRLFDFSFDLTKTYTFWSGLIGGTFLTLSTHGTDQYMVQRYLCTDRPRSAAKAVIASGLVVLVQFAFFLFIGVLLFAFYGSNAPVSAPDQVFPHFIANHLPTGLSGLVVAAILAAAMSSSLNALASTSITDFYQPLFAPNRSQEHYMRVSHVITAVWGAVQIAAALFVIGKDRRIVDTVLSIASFTNGPILGLFFLGTFTRRVRQAGALAGVTTGIAVMMFVWARLNVSWQWYVLIGSAVTFVVGYVASVMFERGVIVGEAREEIV